MKDIAIYLERLGLTSLEAKIYLTLLKTGPISMRKFAPMLGLKRTTTYLYIDPLVEKGLIIRVVKGGQKQIAPANPETLTALIEDREKAVDEQQEVVQNVKTEFPEALKAFRSIIPQNKDREDAEIRYYKGKPGVKKIYEEALKAKELCSYVNLEELAEIFPENYHLFDRAFQQNPAMNIFEICEDSPEARKRIETSNRKHVYKLLPRNMKIKSSDILLYQDHIAIIYLKDKISGIVLHNTDLYDNFRLLFDLNWNMLPEWKQ